MLHTPAVSLRFFVFALILILAASCGGDRAQDFDVELFNGERFLLSEQYADKAVVINFWYPSCPPCREEMPEFQRAWESLDGEPVRFLGMFVPKGLDTEPAARRFVAELDLTFDFATDWGGAVSTAYGIEHYPTTWFIKRDGKAAKIYAGPLNVDSITGIIREMTGG